MQSYRKRSYWKSAIIRRTLIVALFCVFGCFVSAEQSKAEVAQEVDPSNRMGLAREQLIVNMQSALSVWEEQWSNSDPDYALKKNRVLDRLEVMLARSARENRLPQTVQQAVAMAEMARKDVEAGVGVPVQQVYPNVSVIQLPKSADAALREHNEDLRISRNTDDINNTIASALYNIEKGGAGIGSYAKNIPFFGGQTAAAALEADLNKITSNAIVGAHLAIRQDMNPQELAYRLLMYRDFVNDLTNGRGQVTPDTNLVVPMSAGYPRSGLPTIEQIQNAESPGKLLLMGKAFDKYPVFGGCPPKMIDAAIAERISHLSSQGGQ